MTKLYFKVDETYFTSYKEAKAYQAEIAESDFWGIPDIKQIYVEEICKPHGVSEFEGFVNPKLKIKRA